MFILEKLESMLNSNGHGQEVRKIRLKMGMCSAKTDLHNRLFKIKVTEGFPLEYFHLVDKQY